jgi:hypothetical protein
MIHLLNLISGACFVYVYLTRGEPAVVYARAR